MRIAFLWHASHLPVLAKALQPDDRVFSLSQRAFAAAKQAGLPLDPIPFWEVLRGLELETIDRAAAEAVERTALREKGFAHLDRPRVWHDAREASYAGLAAERAIRRFRPAGVVAVDGAPESDAVLAVSRMLGVPTTLVPLPPAAIEPLPIDPPQKLVAHSSYDAAKPWTLVVGTAIADWGMIFSSPRLARKPLLLVVDALTSGDLPALYETCLRRGDVNLLPLWRATTQRYSERGDNAILAEEVASLFDRLVSAKPELAVMSDLRRIETVVALRKLKKASVPVVVVGHSGASMQDPYRFSAQELANTEIRAWTRSAARDYGSTLVETPRRIRTSPPRRMMRAIAGTLASFKRRNIGVVVTTAAVYAAPEHDLAELFESFQRLVAASSDSVHFIVRLREHEDDADVWRTAINCASNVQFESSAVRPMVAFVRQCELLVEVGSESTAFLEAAGNFTPYLRIGQPVRGAARFGRSAQLVPRLDPLRPYDRFETYVGSWRQRMKLALQQHRWLVNETSPRPAPTYLAGIGDKEGA